VRPATPKLLQEICERIERAFPGTLAAPGDPPLHQYAPPLDPGESLIEVFGLPKDRYQDFLVLTGEIYENLCFPQDVWGVTIIHHFEDATRQYYHEVVAALRAQRFWALLSLPAVATMDLNLIPADAVGLGLTGSCETHLEIAGLEVISMLGPAPTENLEREKARNGVAGLSQEVLPPKMNLAA